MVKLLMVVTAGKSAVTFVVQTDGRARLDSWDGCSQKAAARRFVLYALADACCRKRYLENCNQTSVHTVYKRVPPVKQKQERSSRAEKTKID